MKTPDFNERELRRLMAEALDGQLDEAGRRALNGILERSADARRHYRELMDLHARLHLEYTGGREVESMPVTGPGRSAATSRRPWVPAAITAAAACLALLLVFGWRKDGSFATLKTVSGATWESCELPTAEGARLGSGSLRLEQGLVILRFDSGAEVSLEGPVELTLLDAMNCRVTRGTAVANIPDSAIGFRIETPSARVIDHGTRFAVSVDPATGRTLTQVFEGLVDVENASTGEVVALKTGQRGSVDGRTTGPVTDGLQERISSEPDAAMSQGPGWSLIEASKDAYIGPILETDSDVLLYLKREDTGFQRNAYLGFDLTGIDAAGIGSAELIVHFTPTGLGLASHLPDATFTVYGLAGDDEPWDENGLRPHNAPANMDDRSAAIHPDQLRKLGTFVVPQGVQRGRFGIDGETLAGYLRERAGSTLTLIVVRDTAETGEAGLVHGIASHRHPVLPGPTLAIRKAIP
ncbi:hypothetical protein [Haloferula sp. A504]|uniref:hypothetical protein n=1 Tax=Haloferula sp. A504 TaxID=3373601 RepID=UPI0031C76636|nr:FecR domain-containing protein [Verrucomicrobiaceae bacterium E54]